MAERSRKICPLMNTECKKENCAWWFKEDDNCSIAGLANALDYQARTLRDILNHM